jgi:hypothetical protein
MTPIKWILGLFQPERRASGAASVAMAPPLFAASWQSASTRDWIQTRARLPTREDADEDGNVWSYGAIDTVVYKIGWNEIEALIAGTDRCVHTHWMPKPQVQPPAPPGASNNTTA